MRIVLVAGRSPQSGRSGPGVNSAEAARLIGRGDTAMSHVQKTKLEPWRKPWLTQAALWGVVIAWGGLGVWGWLQSASGPVVAVLVAISVCADIVGARMAVHAGQSACRWRTMGCIAWTGFSGKRALALADTQRQAPYEVALAERAQAEATLARIDAAVDALPALRSDIPAVRLQALAEARAAEIARLEARRGEAASLAERPLPPPPPEPLPSAIMWVLVGLIEALKLLGFWAIAKPRQPAPPSVAAGQALAALRWRKAA
jgi:hypothetical protein